MLLQYIVAFCRVVIALTFALSFLSKVRDISLFEETVRRFHVLPNRIAKAVAMLVLTGEIVVVVLVASGQLLGPGFLLATLLLLVFSLAFISLMVRGIQTSCNCFGPSQKPISLYDIIRNFGLILCACSGYFTLWMANGLQTGVSVGEWALLGIIATTFVLILLNLHEVGHLFYTK